MLNKVEIKILSLSLLIKLIIGALLPLFSDEAYYWFWSHHLQLSYFDHPPFIAWLFLLGQGFESFFQAVRWPGIIFGHLAILFWFLTLKGFLGSKERIYWLLFMLLSPLTGPGSLIMTPDIPLMVFWGLSAYLFLKWTRQPNSQLSLKLGASIGLGFLSKYTIVIFYPLALLWTLIKKKFNQRTLSHIAMLLVAFVLFSIPVWIWNMNNDWISFKFQLGHGLTHKKWLPTYPVIYILGQVLLLFPTVFYFGLKNTVNKKSNLFLNLFAWGPLIFFLMTSFKGRVEANWPILAFPPFFALALLSLKKDIWVKWTLGIWAALFLLTTSHLVSPWLPSGKIEKLNIEKFDSLSSLTIDKSPLFADSYQLASKLSYEQKRWVFKLKGFSRVDYFDFLEESTPKSSEFFVVAQRGQQIPSNIKKLGYKIKNRSGIIPDYELLHVVKE